MADVVDSETRSRMMAGIRGKGTKPEMLVRRVMFAAGLRFRLHRKDLPGAPDIVLPGRKVAVFVHGCFWHMHSGCKFAKMPSSNTDFWHTKLSGNVERDHRVVEALRTSGWRVLTVWECATRDARIAPTLGQRVLNWLDSDDDVGEIPPSTRNTS
ncbi:very short patch repair endonuclease [Cupriavidus sp. SS-3]|uniref:very short patch repair endonuclease n=1 Tax=Cupriavidus sp. SS-3 TaxID=3109596 RepID=UPI002DB8CBB3|nr:DNA mismatch endonuclease Vsr [Cupriavidus sp. SS-3]MEC3767271.1 DNA mismatch endonuclease Vsr [Cupriavidus sp. SS-3]